MTRACVAFVLFCASPAFATTFTVTSGADDTALDGLVTLREALTAANTNAPSGDAPAGSAGLDTIDFTIPGAGVHTITLSSSLTITEAVVIDGYSQPGARANDLAVGDDAVLTIEIDGTSTAGAAGAIILSSTGSTLRGLVVNHAAAAGVSIVKTSGNTVAGCFLGVDATGSAIVANNSGVRISDSSGNTVGGSAPADRNVIGGGVIGVLIDDQTPTPLSGTNVVRGNYIGTDASGTRSLPTSNEGIYMTTNATGNLITNNLISGNAQLAIYLAPGYGVTIASNLIGVASDGKTALGNDGGGLQIIGGQNMIGGTAPGAGNVIADNVAPPNGSSCGVRISSASSSGNSVLGNSIYGNSTLGISLGDGMPTPNDVGDNDTGPNGLQNFPVLASATFDGTSTTIEGTLSSAASNTYRVELFGNDACDVSGYGQGARFLGAVSVTTNASGTASFSAKVAGNAGVVSATATSATGDTSELSACATVTSASPLDLSATRDLATMDLSMIELDLGVQLDGSVPGPGVDLATGSAEGAVVDAAVAPAVSHEGCSCEVAHRGTPAPWSIAMVLALLFVRWRRTSAAALALGLALSAGTAHALCTGATHTWTGAGADANWSTAANWGGSVPGCGSDALVFPAGAAHLATNNDLITHVASTLSVAGDGYSFSGNAVTISSAITSTAPTTGPIFSMQVQTGTAGFTLTNSGASLTFMKTGSGIGLNGPTTFDGTGDITIASLITGGGAWLKKGTHRLYLAGSNTSYVPGGLSIQAGPVRVQAASALGDPSAIVTVSGTGVLETEGSTIANALVLDTMAQYAIDHFNTGAGLSGPITLMSDATIHNSVPALLALTGVVSGTGKLTLAGGTVNVYGMNTHTGGTHIASVVQLQGALGMGPIVVDAGAALALSSGITLPNALALAGTNLDVGGALSASGNTLTGALTLTSDATLDITGPVTVSGAIGGPGTLVKVGSGNLVLSNAANAYSGGTQIMAGVLLNAPTSEAIPDTSTVTIGDAGSLILASSEGIGSLTGTGIVSIPGGLTLATGGNGTSTTFGGVVEGNGTLLLVGAGTKTLTGASTFTGDSTITQGTLQIFGATLASLHVTGAIAELGSNAGVGTIQSTGGTLRPGAVMGARTSSSKSIVLDAATRFSVELDGSDKGASTQLAVAGTVTLGGATLVLVVDGTPKLGDQLVVIANDGSDAVVGTFAGAPEGTTFAAGGAGYQVSYVGGDGNDVQLTVVPAPPDMAMPVVADLGVGDDLSAAQDGAPDAPASNDLATTGKHAGGCDAVPGQSTPLATLLFMLVVIYAVSRRL